LKKPRTSEKVVSHSEAETIRIGTDFATRLRSGSVVALYGDLGSGKTRFIKGICAGLGVATNVSSPTFNLVHEYRGASFRVYHFDFYRVHGVAEIADLGFEEYLDAGGVCLIEWADLAGRLLPAERFDVRMSAGAKTDERSIVIESHSPNLS